MTQNAFLMSVIAQLRSLASARFLDNMNGGSGTSLDTHTPDIGAGWRIYNGSNIQLTGNGTTTLTSTSSSATVITKDRFSEREIYRLSLDLVFNSQSFGPGINWHFKFSLSDRGQFSRYIADFYYQGGSTVSLTMYSNGNSNDLSYGPVDIPTSTLGNGTVNTVVFEAHIDYWKLDLNGTNLFNVNVAKILHDPKILLEFDDITVSSAPVEVSRVELADTPLMSPQGYFTCNIDTLPKILWFQDFFSGPNGRSSLSGHIPDFSNAVTYQAWGGYAFPTLYSNNPVTYLTSTSGTTASAASIGAEGLAAARLEFSMTYVNVPTSEAFDAFEVTFGNCTLRLQYRNDGTLEYSASAPPSKSKPMTTYLVAPSGSGRFVIETTPCYTSFTVDGQELFYVDCDDTNPNGPAGQDIHFAFYGSTPDRFRLYEMTIYVYGGGG